ncbi:hypothetical protein Tco_0354147, partial [Tanacetum coccineum]
DYPQRALQNKGIVDSGCFRHMTGNKAYLAEYQDFNGGHVALYEKVKRFDESFTVVGSTEDKRRIKEMNEGVKDP